MHYGRKGAQGGVTYGDKVISGVAHEHRVHVAQHGACMNRHSCHYNPSQVSSTTVGVWSQRSSVGEMYAGEVQGRRTNMRSE